MNIGEIKEAVTDSFMKSLHKIRHKEERESCIHVSALTSDCMRKNYYMHYTNELGLNLMDLEGFLKTTYGTIIHNAIILSDMNEIKMSIVTRKGTKITGRADDIIKIKDKVILVDKKTTRNLLRSAYDNHWTQVFYYGALIDIPIDYVAICYINLAEVSLPQIFVKKMPNKEEILKEIEEKADKLQSYIDKKELPPKTRSWWCKYCDHIDNCSGDVNNKNG